MRKKGSLGFWLTHKDEDWATNEDAYDFGMYTEGTIILESIKHQDKTIEVKIKGPLPNDIIFRELIPRCDLPSALHVVVTWNHDVKLYLNGDLAASKAL